MTEHAQVLIIGGGVMGVSLLFHLSEAGWTDCVLLEKHELTAGSTWHAAGLCTHYAHCPTIMEMRATSVRLYRDELPARTSTDGTALATGFHASGALRVTRSADRMDEFRHVRGLAKFIGYDLHVIDPDELLEIYPLCQTNELVGALWEPHDGFVDPTLATNAMATLARINGAKIHRHCEVTGIVRDGDQWLVHSHDRTIRSRHIVNAAGTWCREVGTMMGVDLPVVPMLHQYLVTDRVPEIAERQTAGLVELPIIRDLEESWYLRQERDGYIVGPYEKDASAWSIDGVPPAFGMELLPPDLDRVEHIVAMAMQRVPPLADAGIKTVVNGPITFTPDANPLIGPAFDLDNAWLLTGSSMGVMEGGGAGAFLAAWMTDGAPPMDPIAVDSRRFGGYADRDYRVAKAVECFGLQFGVHYPYEERPAGRPKVTTPLIERQRDAGALFGCVYGCERPNWFARVVDTTGNRETEPALTFRRPGWMDAVVEESQAVRDAVGLVDLCAFAKFKVTGSSASEFVQQLGANRAPARDGRVGLTHALTPQGGVASEFTVMRVSEDYFYLTSAAAAQRQDADLLRSRARAFGDVRVHNCTSHMGILGLMGPKSRALLEAITASTLSDVEIPWFGFLGMTIAGHPVRVVRMSYVGELGFELHMQGSALAPVYDLLVQAGNEFGLRPFGAIALNAMRLEKAYRAWGADLTTERTPLESGVDFAVRPNGRQFIGRDAMLERAESAQRWSMSPVEIHLDCDVAPFYSHSVLAAGEPIGIITSAALGPRTGKALGLAYFLPDAPADELEVEITGERYKLSRLSRPAYDPDDRRMRGEHP